MNKKLPEKWWPSERCYDLLLTKGITKEFADHCRDEFMLYWLDAGLMKKSWDLTFLNWVKKQYEQCDKTRYYREHIPKDKTVAAPKLTLVREAIKPELSKEERTALADKYLAGLTGGIK